MPVRGSGHAGDHAVADPSGLDAHPVGSVSEHGDVTAAPRRRLALAGAVTGLAGVAASQVVTSLLNGRATPVQVVAEVVIAKTPGPVAESLIHLVGRNDKPILVAGVTVAIVLLGAVAGLLTGAARCSAHLVFWAMAAVSLVAAMSRAGLRAARACCRSPSA